MSFFALLPPEINSLLIYSGDGSSTLTQAAAAWNAFGEELHSTATAIMNTISGLGSTYQGPSAAAMDGAITPFATFLHTIAEQAVQIGTQASGQAGLYQTAHGAVIPPAVIATNRAELLVLIATNWLGQNAPLIAANEAEYHTYWTTDAAVMEAYSQGTQANTAATPQTASPSAAANQVASPSLSDSGTSWLTNLLNHVMPSGSQIPAGASWDTIGTDVWNAISGAASGGSGAGATGTASAFQSIYYPLMMASIPARILPSILMQLARMGSMGAMGATSLASQTAGGGPTALMTQIGEFVDDKLKGAVGVLANHFSTATNSISAKLGQAASMGQLRVPQTWSPAAEGMVRAAPVLPHTTVSAPVQTMSASGMPGGPFGNAMMGALAGRGIGSVAAKAPKIVPRSPSGG